MIRTQRQFQFEPALSLNILCRRRVEGNIPKVLQGKNVELLFCGTAAVARSIHALRLKDSDVVLMPDYNCGIEVSAVLDAGAKVEFYRVRSDASIDFADLQMKAVPPVKALYIIHYFGFPQTIAPVIQLAGARGMFVIEDCAHSLYSRYGNHYLGESGDIAVFSPRKTLPLMDGGALRYNLSALSKAELSVPPEWVHTAREFFYSLSRFSARNRSMLSRLIGRWLLLFSKLIYLGRRMEKPLSDVGSRDYGSVKHRLNWRMSTLSRVILERTNHNEVIRKRRDNYRFFLEHLPADDSIIPLFPTLPKGVCPLYFPLMIRDRDGMYEYLKSQQIEVFRYWRWKHPAISGEDHAEAELLRKQMLCLPIHQDLSESDLAVMLELIEEYSPSTSSLPEKNYEE